MRRLHLILALLAAGCGAPEPATAPAPRLQLTFAPSPTMRAAAATAPANPPVMLVFHFAGPDGAREVTADYADHAVDLADFAAGRWQVAGEGLDAAGAVQWVAPRTPFTVQADRRVTVELTFSPAEE